MNDSNSDSTNESLTATEEADMLDPFLCFPESMTKHQLLRLFKMRSLSPPKEELIDGYEYCNLIALYNQVLLPLPQRKYGNNRKSKELAVKQIDCNKRSGLKRKLEESNTTNDNYGPYTQLKARLIGQYSGDETNDNSNAQQMPNQRHDTKRPRISWP